MSENNNVIIIGGSVVGCITARFLSRYQLNILLIEKEEDLGLGTSAANAALVHPGYNPVNGPLIATLNVAAFSMWPHLAGHWLQPVYPASPFPKGKTTELLAALRSMKVPVPLQINQVLLADVLGSGVDGIASRDIN